MLNSSSVSSSTSENEISASEELTFNTSRQKRESRKLSLQQALNLSKGALDNLKKSDAYIRKMSAFEEKSIKLCPAVEGRIVCIRDKDVSLSRKIATWIVSILIHFVSDC
jgi:hypothetical protein